MTPFAGAFAVDSMLDNIAFLGLGCYFWCWVMFICKIASARNLMNAVRARIEMMMGCDLLDDWLSELK